MHYAVKSNNDKLVKYLCSIQQVEVNEKTKTNQIQPIDLSIVGVSRNALAKQRVESEEKQYLKQARNLRLAQRFDYFVDDSPDCQEEKITNILVRYNNMALSDYESDGDDEEKGDVYKKSKKGKKKKKKKGKGSAKTKTKGGKKGKKK